MLLIQNTRANGETFQIGIPGATAKNKENREQVQQIELAVVERCGVIANRPASPTAREDGGERLARHRSDHQF
jgi:hypothetical protein